jgi:hypothetical protein
MNRQCIKGCALGITKEVPGLSCRSFSHTSFFHNEVNFKAYTLFI